MLHVGDYIVLKKDEIDRYSITNENMILGLIKDYDPTEDEDIYIEIMLHRHRSNIGSKYWVNSNCFEKVNMKNFNKNLAYAFN